MVNKLPIGRKILRDLSREKTFMLAVFLQLIIILSMSILLSYTSLFFNPERTITEPLKIGYLEDTQLIDMLYKTDKVDLIRYQLLNNSISDFKEGKIDGVVYEEQSGSNIILNIYVPENKLKSALVLSLLKKNIDDYDSMLNNDYYHNEYIIPIHNVKSTRSLVKGIDVIYEILYGYLLPFILLLPIFLIGTLMIDVICEEIETKRINIILSVTKMPRFVYEAILAGLLLIFLQEIIWILLISLKGITINNIEIMLGYIFLFSLLSLMIAIIISLASKSKSKSQLIFSIFVVFLTAMTNVTAFSPVNTVGEIIIGIKEFHIASFGIILVAILLFALLLKNVMKEYYKV